MQLKLNATMVVWNDEVGPIRSKIIRESVKATEISKKIHERRLQWSRDERGRKLRG